MIVRTFMLVAVFTGLLASGAMARSASPVTLRASVGPGFTITLSKAGKPVKQLSPGFYRFVISDRSAIHSFSLKQTKGGSFTKALTTVPFVGSKTVTVRLTRGSWRFFCPPHQAFMFGTFTVR